MSKQSYFLLYTRINERQEQMTCVPARFTRPLIHRMIKNGQLIEILFLCSFTMSPHTNKQNSQGFSPQAAHNHRAPQQFSVRLGQGRGVLGHREGKSGNRVESNPDGSRKNKKH